jgi:hypothetical protein
MIDAAVKVEPGFLRDQQNAAAVRTFRPAQVFGRKNPCGLTLARGLYDHRRSLLDARSPHPIARYVEGRVWRRRDALMKLPWLWKVPEQRNEIAGFAFRRVGG